MMPPSPCIGSSTIAAVFVLTTFVSFSILLYCICINPESTGSNPFVSFSEPAAEIIASERPWKLFSKVIISVLSGSSLL